MTCCHILLLLDFKLFSSFYKFLFQYRVLHILYMNESSFENISMNDDENLCCISALKIKGQIQQLGCICVLWARCSWEESSCRRLSNLLRMCLCWPADQEDSWLSYITQFVLLSRSVIGGLVVLWLSSRRPFMTHGYRRFSFFSLISVSLGHCFTLSILL